MKKQKILYAITTEDVCTVSKEEEISFAEKDLDFIQNKIGDFFGSQWQDAIKYALRELNKNN